MDIKRYRPHSDNHGLMRCTCGMTEDPAGDYIEFDDHEAEVKRLEAELARFVENAAGASY